MLLRTLLIAAMAMLGTAAVAGTPEAVQRSSVERAVYTLELASGTVMVKVRAGAPNARTVTVFNGTPHALRMNADGAEGRTIASLSSGHVACASAPGLYLLQVGGANQWINARCGDHVQLLADGMRLQPSMGGHAQ